MGGSNSGLPFVSSRRGSDDDDDKEKKRRWPRNSRVGGWLARIRAGFSVSFSRVLLTRGGARSAWKWLALLLLTALVLLGATSMLVLEVVGQLRFRGYFVPPRTHNGQLGFYHEMDVDMQTLRDATDKPHGKLFPAGASSPREVKAWMAERRRRTNGRKFLVGCTADWRGYVLRSFLSLFEELKSEHGWEDLDTSRDPTSTIYHMDRKRAPSVLLFCLNSFHYPMALLQEYSHYFRELRALGTVVAVWNDDLHYYDQFDPVTLRDDIFTKVDVLLGTYTYLMDDYFATVTESVSARDLPLTVWLPHSSGPDFVNASFNEYPINKILLSGKLGSNWYPLRHWLGSFQEQHGDIMDLYQHSGYYVANNQSAIYASYLRSYRTGITTTLLFQYVIAKVFEIPSTGALLAVNRDVAPLLTALGLNEGEHYVGFDRRDPEAMVWWLADPENHAEIDRIRLTGMQAVRRDHQVSNRVQALELFLTQGEATYNYPTTLRVTSPCPSRALPDESACQRRYDREAMYKCDRWFCGFHSLMPRGW